MLIKRIGMLLKAIDRIIYEDLLRVSDDRDVTAVMSQTMKRSYTDSRGLESVIEDLCTASSSIEGSYDC